MRRFLSFFLLAATLTACATHPAARKVSIIPEPVNVRINEGQLTIKPSDLISVSDTSLLDIATYYATSIEKANGLKLTPTSGDSKAKITLSTTLQSENPEAYTFTSTEDGIDINAASPAGLIMAASTLQQLLPNNAATGANIALVEITDEPRFGYRGLHLDVSRHFYTQEQVQELLDLMARYKLNKFHWHLTDDQGWRVEIKQYPLLIDSASYRHFNGQDRQCQAYEKSLDDPMFKIPTELMKINGTDTLYGGSYTQDQIREVVTYAAQRGIDILPEVDMPGHLMGAILGYPYLSCKGKAQWGASFSDPLCVGSDSALQMVKNIYTEIATLFPYEYMHLGADEVEKTNWKACPKCQARMKANGLKNEKELQAWFVKDMEKHFNSLGKKLIGWDEIIDGGLSETATIMWWRDWAPEAVPMATKAGNKAILSPCFSMYFDAWEGPDTFKGTYTFDPILPSLDEQQAANVLGVQGNLWCETIPSFERAQNMYFPRLLALAESGWSPKDAKNFDSFFTKVINEVEFLDYKGIKYRLPNLTGFGDINVFTDTTTVTVNSPLPNIAIRYTTDGTFPNAQSALYTKPLKITESTDFTFRGFRPDGSAGEMFKSSYVKETFAPPLTDFTPTKTGVQFKHYNYKGVYNKKQCHLVDSAPLAKEYVMDSIHLNKEIQGFMGLVAIGYIEIEKDGIYTFKLKSNDGSTLAIDNQMLIDNDSTHGDKEMSAQKALAKGWHKIEVRFFDLNNGGTLRLMLDDKVLSNFKH